MITELVLEVAIDLFAIEPTLTTATLVGVHMGCGENRVKMHAYTYLDSHLSHATL